MVVADVKSEENEENVTDNNAEEIHCEPIFTLEILKIIKDAQQQHGLRHGDYQRYRGYCTRRIRRLRKVLHIIQGDRRHFKRKDVTEAHLKDEKYLYIPLMQAERAWGYAMQLRQEANTEPRKRFHLCSRLRKATLYADQLQKLCESSKCDARTKLEAQAYVAWIYGSLYFELKKWKPAMENLEKALVVYEKLCGALPEEDQLMYRQRCDELDPSLRFCTYNIRDEGGDTAIEDLISLRGQAHGDLLDNLDSLMAQTRERRSEVLSEAQWRGRNFPVRPERVRLFLLAERDLENAQGKTDIEHLERHLMDCKDAIAALKEEMKSEPGTKGKTSTTSLQYLLSYLTYIRLSRTVQRNLLMIESAKSCMSENTENEGRKTRPQDLTRLYEIILQNLAEMQQLTGLEEDNEFQNEIEAKITAYKAFRCFYISEVLSGLRRWREAGALYHRAEAYIISARGSKALPSSLKTELNKLLESIDSARYSALAYAALEGEPSSTATTPTAQTGSVVGKGSKAKKVPLIERLEEYWEDPGLANKQPNIMKLPPDMQPIPCKPLFFDLALNLVEFPSLEDKLDASAKKANAAGLTGFVKGLWGWGGKK
ncbi:signal recognition particle 68 [Lycorma delicatula]|uniref:signal recognition particle 68 n=1 Tax=Lycorma delicatula TaxID=130591 RepID=UPI003F5155B7